MEVEEIEARAELGLSLLGSTPNVNHPSEEFEVRQCGCGGGGELRIALIVTDGVVRPTILFPPKLRRLKMVVSVALDKSAGESDKLSLLSFKDKIAQDPLQVLNSWNDSVSFCEWTGIICDSNNQRVVTLSLEGWRLAGSLTPSIGNLTFLTGINLRNNSFHGEIPQDLGRLSHLQYLNLTRNLFSGEIPQNLSHCLDLKVLDVVYNELVGNIPNQLSSLTKLEILGLGANNLTGAIPPWIGNFSSLLLFLLQ
ncbi:hypothetical protein Scep_005617 [Stephania cephalantha]|uniref:Leucine-rich repeat-containing N-terminal plant-type domain-containing protein n=1 Tax=Stephania cephalantha TaxID=152367 RepID=A0AAP0KUM2_9MAGN